MESKIDATDRLRKDGRWAEASSFRDQRRSELRAQGLSRNVANELAWTAMIEKFPPAESVMDRVELEDFDEEGMTPANAGDWVRDVLYTYDNIGRNNPEKPPSSGAGCLLNWARKNQDRFFDSLLPRAVAVAEKNQIERKRFEDDGRKIFKRLDAFVADFRQKQQTSVENFASRFAKKLAPIITDSEPPRTVPEGYLNFLTIAITEVINGNPGLVPFVE